jgi:prevent-host-death family protein
MNSINLAEAKAHLSELVSKAEKGEETIIMRRGEAVAKLIPMTVPKKKFRSLADFRATLPKAAKPSVALIRDIRDDGY